MSYMMLLLLFVSLVAIGVINYRNTTCTASKLLESLQNE